MSKNQLLSLLVISLLSSILLYACTPKGISEQITDNELKEHVEYLASDSLMGRKTGSHGSMLAATYIRDQFEKAGLKLLNTSGFQEFELITKIQTGAANALIIDNDTATLETDFIPFSFSSNGNLKAEIAFAGYGFEISSDTLKWNDYENLDVEGKWVLLLRGGPEYSYKKSVFIPFEGERNKVLTAKDHGAAGVLFVNPVEMSKEDKLTNLYFDKTALGAGVPVIHISRVIANKIIDQTGDKVEELEQLINKQFAPVSMEIEKTLNVSVELLQKTETAQNVVAILPGSDPELKDEHVVIGSHYDHLGMGGKGSGSRSPDTTAVHNGADDNASGVATVIEMAEYFSHNPPKRSIIFVAFDAEEMGLLGAKHFVKNAPFELETISAMLNFDMIGRLKKESKTLTIGGTGTSVEADSLLQLHLDTTAFNLVYSPNGYGPSDHAAFYSENIPVFFLTTGAHSEYHTPGDDVDLLNFHALQSISYYGINLITSIANHPKKLNFRESGTKRAQGQRTNLKVTLGIIPDFSGVVKTGLGVDGVRKGGPADLSGMQKGDAIVAINGLSVGNIYDYMNRLKKLKAGSTITVEVIRNDKKVVLLVQL